MARETASPTGQAAPVQVPQPGSQKTLPVQTGQGCVGQEVHRVQWEFQALALPVFSVQLPPSAREQKRVCPVLPLLREQALALLVSSVQVPPSAREQKQVCSVLPLLQEQAPALPVSFVQEPPAARERKQACSVLPLLQEQALALLVSSVQVPPSAREQKRACSVLPLLQEPLLWVVSEPGLGQVLQVLRRPFQTDGRICRSIFVPLNVQEPRNVDILS